MLSLQPPPRPGFFAQREREAEARRQEGYNRLLEEAGQGSDDEEWTQVDAPASHAGRRQQQQGQQAQQQGRRQATPTSPRRQQQRSGGDASKVLAVNRSAIASAVAMPLPKRASPTTTGASWAEQVAAPSAGALPAAPSSSTSSATAVAAEPAGPGPAAEGDAAVPAGGCSFDAWQQQEQQEVAAPPQQHDAELDSLLAVSTLWSLRCDGLTSCDAAVRSDCACGGSRHAGLGS